MGRLIETDYRNYKLEMIYGGNYMNVNDIQERVKQIIITNMEQEGISINVDQLEANNKLEELGINSLIFIKILVNIESEYEIQFSDEDLDIHNEKFSTFANFIDFIVSQISQ